MEANQAAEHLQTIRTLMERAALYRRALAPVMLLVGAIGCVAAGIGYFGQLNTDFAFLVLWGASSVIALASAFLLIRRQALKEAEPFWTPPTRRIVEAIAPSIAFGAVIAMLYLPVKHPGNSGGTMILAPLWTALYGCALHAAGFFMPRGIKLLGWMFIGCGSALLIYHFAFAMAGSGPFLNSHLVMGGTFGGLHLAAGVYLYLTEKQRNES